MRRSLDPVSHTFQTDALEAGRAADEARTRAAEFARFVARMPENERRAHCSGLNVVTGECGDVELAQRAIEEFPRGNLARAVRARNCLAEIVQGRERDAQIEVARVPCRYNNGREREIRDWNIVDGRAVEGGLDAAVRDLPQVWEWCTAERLSE
jgi:hypothetical protein